MNFSGCEAMPMVGRHPLLLVAQQLGRRVASCEFPINIMGETGTGKGLYAKFIHMESPRRNGPFVAVDCGLLSRDMARSELFGFVRGAFTGAVETRPGLVETASGGTLFLDEIGELDADLQLHLLRLVQDGEFRRVGESAIRHSNVRLITATHRDLAHLVATNKFREDLYYRLTVIPILLPSLRERRSDIPLLIEHFCKSNKHVPHRPFSEEALSAMMRYHWPGNVRQLAHEVARLQVMTDAPCIEKKHLPDFITKEQEDVDEYDLPYKDARHMHLQKFMREYLHRKLIHTQGNVSQAAKMSGIGRQYFQVRMLELGMRSETYRRMSRLDRGYAN